MTEVHIKNETSAALLFESDPVKANTTDIRDEDSEMLDSFDPVSVKAGSISSSTSRSVSVEAKMEHGSHKSTPSATPALSTKKGKLPKAPTQLIGHLPRAEEDAMNTFTQIPGNHYQYGTLGKSREAGESMTCDCQYDHGTDDPDVACGHNSDCINRLTQVECLPDDCRCRTFCQNQRFQRKQYAPIEIVKTDMKGFGLRAAQSIHKDAFIYEYVGDVVSQPSFLKRMRLYAEEGIRHFYFMMLQKDEFIDATKRGGIGRFANHSCNPNCYVAKWTVGDHVRMGIFANRTIQKHEELTFNYNVDRYGHDAQPCFCGEPNCVGFIGGKTQTDLAAMDDLYLDALGISDEVEKFGLKGSKKKKGKKLDEDFVPDLKPIIFKDVPKVVQAMRQTQSRKVLVKLLARLKLTEDHACLRQIMRLRGFSVMTNILNDHSDDVEVKMLAMEAMTTWPLIQRNKVEDSKVNIPVQLCTQSDNESMATLARKLLAQWEALEYAYRIPKRIKGMDEDTPQDRIIIINHDSDDERPFKRSRAEDFPKFVLPSMMSGAKTPERERVQVRLGPSRAEMEVAQRAADARRQQDIAAIIAKAARAAEEAANKPKPDSPAPDPEPSRKKSSSSRHSSKHKRPPQTSEEREANKEKRLLKLIGAVVVRCMSKYRDQMDHDQFKLYAKELTHIIAEKEKKSSTYKENKLDSLSEEKTAKIKKFAKEYIAKVLRKLDKSGKRRKPISVAGSSSTPDSRAEHEHDNSAEIAATVADLMDLDPHDDADDAVGDDGSDGGGDEPPDDDGDNDRASGSRSPDDGGAGSAETSPTVVSDSRGRHPPEKVDVWGTTGVGSPPFVSPYKPELVSRSQVEAV